MDRPWRPVRAGYTPEQRRLIRGGVQARGHPAAHSGGRSRAKPAGPARPTNPPCRYATRRELRQELGESWRPAGVRAFRAAFKQTLEAVHTQYRGARVELDQRGMTLRRSPPPKNLVLITRT